MKKVVFFINSLAGGGAERILTTIIAELQSKFIVTLVLMEDRIEYIIPNNIKVIYLNKNKLNSSGLTKVLNIGLFAYKLAKVCNIVDADYCFSLTSRPNLINSLSKLFGNKSKTILYEVATPSIQYSQKNITSLVAKSLIKILYPKCNTLVANSLGVTQDLKENLFIKNKIKTIYSPIDVEDIKKLSKKEVSLNCDKDCIKFITIGRLDYGKNHKMMINSFSKIYNKKTILYILGEGELKNELLNLVSKLNLNERVIFLGFDNNPYKYLNQSDIFLFTSKFEGFPTVLIEALACNLPIISTDCPNGPREILDSIEDYDKQIKNDIKIGEYGILSPVDNEELFTKAINIIINDVNLRTQYKLKTTLRANYFNKDSSIKMIENLMI